MKTFEFFVSETGRKMVMHHPYPQFVVLLSDKSQGMKSEIRFIADLFAALENNINALEPVERDLMAWLAEQKLEL